MGSPQASERDKGILRASEGSSLDAPDVSVLLPVYNAARYLEEAVKSVLGQTLQNLEVVAINDGSSDGSLDVLHDFAQLDSRVRVFSRPNTGIVGALNDGLKECRAELVARMDADDVCLPYRFSEQVAHMRQHPECVALGSAVLYTDPETDPLIPHEVRQDHEGIVAQLLEGNGGAMIHPSVMMRRAAVEQVGGYRTEYQWIEDLDLFLRLSEVGQLANLSDVMLKYRQHVASVNRTRGSRAELCTQLVNPRRRQAGLPDLTMEVPEGCDAIFGESGWRRHWAYDAARGRNWRTARKNATKALLLKCRHRENWKCWRYVMRAGWGKGNVDL